MRINCRYDTQQKHQNEKFTFFQILNLRRGTAFPDINSVFLFCLYIALRSSSVEIAHCLRKRDSVSLREDELQSLVEKAGVEERLFYAAKEASRLLQSIFMSNSRLVNLLASC